MTFYAVSLKLPTRLERSLRLVDTERAWAPSPRPPVGGQKSDQALQIDFCPPTGGLAVGRADGQRPPYRDHTTISQAPILEVYDDHGGPLPSRSRHF